MENSQSSPVRCWTQTLASSVWERQRTIITQPKYMSGSKNQKLKKQNKSSVWAPLFLFLCSVQKVFDKFHFHSSLSSSPWILLSPNTTMFLTTPFPSSSVLFIHCHGDYKDTRINWWGFGAQRRIAAQAWASGSLCILYVIYSSVWDCSGVTASFWQQHDPRRPAVRTMPA